MNSTDTLQNATVDTRSEAYQRARRHARQLRGFYSSLFIYVVIVAFLAVLNLWTDASYLWVAWVALFWGLGMAMHAYFIFVANGPFGRNWEERKTRDLMERERRGSTDNR